MPSQHHHNFFVKGWASPSSLLPSLLYLLRSLELQCQSESARLFKHLDKLDGREISSAPWAVQASSIYLSRTARGGVDHPLIPNLK